MVLATAPTEDTATADPSVQAEADTSVDPAPTVQAVTPPTKEELLAKRDAVFSYQRNHKIVPQVFSKRTSTRPLCAGCAFGIRGETDPRYLDGLPFHPNCAKAFQDPAFAIKLSPRYLAAAVPIMTVLAHDTYRSRIEAPAVPDDADEEPEVIEDSTTDLVQAAVARTRRRRSA